MSSDRTRAGSGERTAASRSASAAETAVQPAQSARSAASTPTAQAGRPQAAAQAGSAQPAAAGAQPAGQAGGTQAGGDQEANQSGSTEPSSTGEGRQRFWRRSKPARGDDMSAAKQAAAAHAAAAAAAAQARPSAGPRRVRLAVSRVDPWSIMKLSFLLSIAIGIALVVATAVIWNVLNTMQVFTQADGIVTDIAGTESFIDILDYVQFSRVMSIAVVIAVVDVVILTALATLFAFVYNVTAALVGGLHVTLTDE